MSSSAISTKLDRLLATGRPERTAQKVQRADSSAPYVVLARHYGISRETIYQCYGKSSGGETRTHSVPETASASEVRPRISVFDSVNPSEHQ